MNKIKELIYNKDWDSLILSFTVEEICSSLTFSESMHTVNHLFFDDFRDDDRQQYALKLAFQIKEHFKDQWENDWKNEMYLGGLCNTLWLYEEEYQCYKRAYEKFEDPPIELLLRLSGCNIAPPPAPITDEESEFYLKKALEKKLTYEVASAFRYFYRWKEDKAQENYWDKVCKKLKKYDQGLIFLSPDILKK